MQITKTLLLFLTLIFQNCNTTEPPVKVEKNPREYAWTMDTLYYPGGLQTLLRSIWGSSANDLYCVGHSDEFKGQIWHYNGTQWTSLYIPMGLVYTPTAVYGFSANDIWIAGDGGSVDSAFIMHYDGNTWKRVYANEGKLIETIWGRSSNDVWFGGLNGTKIFHWDGVSIKKDSIPYYTPDGYTQVLSINGNTSGEVYFLLFSYLVQDHMSLFMNKQNNWSVIDSSVWGYDRKKVWVSNEGSIYETGDGGFFRWNGSGWNNLLGEINGITCGIKSLSENNMFIVGWDSPAAGGTKGIVYHYDGKDFYTYENLQLDDVTFMDVWWNGEEAFIVGYTHNYPQKTIILHGE